MVIERNLRKNRWTLPIVFAGVVLLLVVLAAGPCTGHDDLEPPAYRYSKEANLKQEHAHSHGAGGHGHSHGGAGHHGHAHGGAGHHGHAHGGHGHADDHPEKEESTRPPRDLQMWMEAIGATLLISAAPFCILFLVPLDNSKEREPLLKVLLAFASGGLLGDAFLHLIPHALMAQSEIESAPRTHSHSHLQNKHNHVGDAEGEAHGHDMSVGLWVLFGIVTFLMVEKLVRLIKDDGHGHSHGPRQPEKKEKQSDDEAEGKSEGSKKKKKADKKEKKEEEDDSSNDIKVAGYLNLAADFTHNFTDGLAIGASFLAGRSIGIVTTATILLHEVPHEIGDFAILIQSGCSRKKAIFLQLSTAVGAVTGTLVSLLADGIGGAATNWILPFTAGGFIYIATVSVIPELLVNTRFGQSVKEIIALLVGVYMMVLIADYE